MISERASERAIELTLNDAVHCIALHCARARRVARACCARGANCARARTRLIQTTENCETGAESIGLEGSLSLALSHLIWLCLERGCGQSLSRSLARASSGTFYTDQSDLSVSAGEEVEPEFFRPEKRRIGSLDLYRSLIQLSYFSPLLSSTQRKATQQMARWKLNLMD